MTETPDERQAALETMTACREAREKSKPGSKEYKYWDDQYRKAEVAFHDLGKGN